MVDPYSHADSSTGELVSRLAQDMSTLIRDELRLAQAETSAKAKKAGLGIGLAGGAGMIALFGIGALVAAAILALDLVVPAWLAAVIVGVALLLIAGVTALVGKREIGQAAPPVPTEAVEGLKTDVQTVRAGVRR